MINTTEKEKISKYSVENRTNAFFSQGRLIDARARKNKCHRGVHGARIFDVCAQRSIDSKFC